ncbi:MAG: GyrI-like domain-containing protein [Rhodospirillaceae bacterium]
MSPTKTDLKKTYKALFAPKAEPQIVTVPPLPYLMIDGKGAPESPAFSEAIAVLYPVAYAIKFHCKTARGFDFVVPPLEALWWADDWGAFVAGDRAVWQWTAMIMQPEQVTVADLAVALAALDKKKKKHRDHDRLRLATREEGTAVQVLHTGAYSAEGPVIAAMHAFAAAAGFTLSGNHHEVYLSDARRTAPEKLKTVLRQPLV